MHRKMFIRLALTIFIATGGNVTQLRGQTAPPTPGQCQDGVLPSGALSRVCIPTSGWNGDLVLWAHGYTAFNEPLDFQNLQLPDGTSLPDLVQSLGFAFATTSYRQNGLAILEGVDDMRELVAAFPPVAGGRAPQRTYLTGASEGGIVTALALERSPQLFSGGLAACGPVGEFRGQINYWADFRVLFDYFYPGVIPGDPINVPDEVIQNFDSVYVPAVTQAVQSNPGAARQLLRTSRAPTDAADPSTVLRTILNLLWYNVFATNDGVQKFGGNPYGNRDRWYFGSDNDLRLNFTVRRYSASPTALAALNRYQTSGRLSRPLVTLHTTGDEIIPFWHEYLYLGKARVSGRGSLLPIPVSRYGHCNFTAQEVLTSFGLLVLQVTGSQPSNLQQALTTGDAQLGASSSSSSSSSAPTGKSSSVLPSNSWGVNAF